MFKEPVDPASSYTDSKAYSQGRASYELPKFKVKVAHQNNKSMYNLNSSSKKRHMSKLSSRY